MISECYEIKIMINLKQIGTETGGYLYVKIEPVRRKCSWL